VEIEVKVPKIVNAKILKIQVKCSDAFSCDLVCSEGSVVRSYEGYVPDIMPGKHYGDYVMLDIDIDTGMILNWKVPTKEQMRDFINY